jgi:predicted component of viral defense system (DUF524 family)
VSDITVGQRVAFLKSFIGSEVFERSMYRIEKRPHVCWRDHEERRPPAQGVSGRSGTAKALVGPGIRVPWPQSVSSTLATLPRLITCARTEADCDNSENRFVKFVLESWRDFLTQTHCDLRALGPSAATGRGIRDVDALAARLEQALACEVFRGLGSLQFIPSSSAVLQREEGYRDFYGAFVKYHGAAHVTWSGGEDVFAAGQRNVATLYEYWCFLRLARIVAGLTESSLDWMSLLVEGGALRLRRGQGVEIEGKVVRNGSPVRLALWFNRTFRPIGAHESWTGVLRPDVSLRIETPTNAVWIHFDAKYEVESPGALGLDALSETIQDSVLEAEVRGDVRRASLMKMHAYRDGIFGSAGVYVLYPGSSSELARKYSELLPGLGAFVLRPLAGGEAFGDDAVGEFIASALDFLTTPTTNFAKASEAARTIYGWGSELS